MESEIAWRKAGCCSKKAETWPPLTQRTSDDGQWAASSFTDWGETYASSVAPTSTAALVQRGLQVITTLAACPIKFALLPLTDSADLSHAEIDSMMYNLGLMQWQLSMVQYQYKGWY